MNVAPSPGSLTTPALPPCASAIAATMARPRPGPLPLVGVIGVVVATPRRIRAVERLEDVRGLVGGESRSSVAHLHLGPAVVLTHANRDGRSGRRVGQRVREQVGHDLAQPVVVARDGERLRHVELDRARRIDGSGVVHGVAGDAHQIHRVVRDRTALSRPGQEQQILDEHAHPLALLLDPAHRQRGVGRVVRRPAAEQLRVAADRRERRAQLVRRVGEEPTERLLRCAAFVHRLLDPTEHHVQRRAEASHLRAGIRLLHPSREIAGGDRLGRHLDLLERTEPAPDRHHRQERHRGQHHQGHGARDEQQPVERVGQLHERDGDHQRRPIGEPERSDAVLGPAAPRADREQGRIAKRAAADRGRQVRRREHVAAVVEDHGLPDLVAGGTQDHAERSRREDRIALPRPGTGPGRLGRAQREQDLTRRREQLLVDALHQVGAERGVRGDVRDQQADGQQRDERDRQPHAEGHALTPRPASSAR